MEGLCKKEKKEKTHGHGQQCGVWCGGGGGLVRVVKEGKGGINDDGRT